MNESDFKNELDQIGALIRRGEVSTAKVKLLAFPPKQVPRQLATDVADMARRLSLPEFTLKVLQPIVRADPPLEPKASERELALFSIALSQIGARREAKHILEELKASDHADVHLAWIYCLVPEWDYKDSIRPLKKYIRSESVLPYQKLVGKINLAACYVFLEYQADAHRLLKDIQKQARKEGAKLILGNALELSAQLAIQQNDLLLATKYLEEFSKTIEDANNVYGLYAKKWMAIVNYKKKKDVASLGVLQALKDKARELRNWETIRDIDYQLGVIHQDEFLLNLVYRGTPYQSYRKRIEGHLGQELNLKKGIVFDIRTLEPTSDKDVFDLFSGMTPQGNKVFNPGQAAHKTFSILLQDFYKPTTIGELFGKLYPEEYFDPFSSPQRTFQNVFRLNKILENQNIPVHYTLDKDGFKRIVSEPFAVLCTNEDQPPNEAEIPLRQLAFHFESKPFNTRDAEKVLSFSRRKIHGLLNTGVSQDLIKTAGNGRSKIYAFKIAYLRVLSEYRKMRERP